jgi:oxygen-dependent protoporphyrinogen oxidase
MARVIVIGAGITGLTAAHRLQQRGVDVTVIERSDQIGGRMACTRRDGFTINRASGILPGSYHQIRGLIDELGLSGQTRLVSTEFGIPVDGVTHRLRTYGAGMVADALRTRLLSPRSKLLVSRLLLDAYRARGGIAYADAAAGAPYDTESAAAYCRRRLNEEILERIVDPVVRGMFLVSPEEVSVVDLHFMIMRILGRGQLEYRGGIDFVVRALAARVPVITGATAAPVERVDGGVRVGWSTSDGTEHSERVDGCVLAVSGPELLALHPGIDPIQRDVIVQLGWADSIVGHFALRSRPAETALLTAIPWRERPELSLVVHHDVVAPDCVPPGKGLVSGYWMDDWSRPRMRVSDEELLPLLLDGIEQFVPGIARLVEFFYIDRWHPVVLRCPRGVYAELATLSGAIDPDDPIQLAGDYFGYGSTNRCSITGEQAAARLTRSSGRPGRSSDLRRAAC